MSRDRLLVIDADLPKRLAPRLLERSRNAISAAALGLAHDVKDPELLRGLAEHYNGKREWVLVTGDDIMPAEHGTLIIETQATIATIFPEYPADITEHKWRVDIVQRWAHAMQDQTLGTVRRYAMVGSQPWRPRRRHIRQIAAEGWTPWRPEDAQQAEAARAGNPSRIQDRLPGIG